MEGNIEKKIYCASCNKRTNHGYILKHVDSSEHPFDIQWIESFFITQCLGCDTKGFLREYGDEQMFDYDEYGDMVRVTDYYVYPEEPKNEKGEKVPIRDVKTFTHVPELIEILYVQVVSSFNSSHYLLCAVGLRMIVEGVCKELNVSNGFLLNEDGTKKVNKSGKEIESGSLEGKINGLKDKEIIVQNQAKILQQIRLLGNVSAHELKIPRKKTIGSGIDIIENILHNIFDLDKYDLKK
ncbi:DUF4145 domain-containing protein [Planococcus sp. ANT_H30]|uniref:DUF4145 domain-containing protein n=1 Tax=Planococcus sp. ANT_H30 TaxID=2597347 RepID=UPI0011EF58B4|nr:DUF4145 domain-containing protein [Planococcus sp. ANT_H30]KAA0958275.1 DUF4145 domain-containing protein [Planococcus sp. ANT_H30]